MLVVAGVVTVGVEVVVLIEVVPVVDVRGVKELVPPVVLPKRAEDPVVLLLPLFTLVGTLPIAPALPNKPPTALLLALLV